MNLIITYKSQWWCAVCRFFGIGDIVRPFWWNGVMSAWQEPLPGPRHELNFDWTHGDAELFQRHFFPTQNPSIEVLGDLWHDATYLNWLHMSMHRIHSGYIYIYIIDRLQTSHAPTVSRSHAVSLCWGENPSRSAIPGWLQALWSEGKVGQNPSSGPYHEIQYHISTDT